MDVISLINNKKRKKHCKGRGNDESSIRMCDLPDPILVLIISSLTTKDAVRTSVLSKRWLHLWRDISKIELTEGTPKKRQQFIEFVTRLLLVCDCSSLKKFSLSCKVGEDASQVNEWLQGFINPKIQELSLRLKGIEEPLAFPDHLFTCATLTEFQLNMQHIFKLPSSIHFECLRTLTLLEIIFRDSSSTQQLFSGCPSLEELTLIDCDLKNVKAVCISSPLLQKIFIKEREDEDDDIGGLNVSNSCEVVIIGTDLKSFTYDGDRPNDYFLYSSTSVINASIQVQVPPERYWGNDWERDAGYFVFKLLKVLPNVEKLSISEISLMAISRTTSLLGHLPLFGNLAELHVASDTPIQLSYEALLTILQNSPCLEVVKFEGGVSLPKDHANRILDPLPMCFSTKLKTIKIYGFSGNEEELCAIKILLQAASVLDTLYICCYSFHFDDYLTGSKRLKKLSKQIVRYPKGSMDCEIDLEYIKI